MAGRPQWPVLPAASRTQARWRRWLACVTCVAILLCTASASAQPRSAEDEELARGQELAAAGKLTEAVDAYLDAYKRLKAEAFLFNAALTAEISQDLPRARQLFEELLNKHPLTADAADLRKHVAMLKAVIDGTPPPAGKDSRYLTRSILKVDTEPAGAPVVILRRSTPADASGTDPPPAWVKVAEGPFVTPYAFSLRTGRYQVKIEPFKDYKAITTEIDILPNRAHELKAIMSQGDFLAFLRVVSPVEGAKIYVDQPVSGSSAVWGRTPRGDYLPAGAHDIRIEAPGFKTFHKSVSLEHGETVEVNADLERLPYGNVRFDSLLGQFAVEVDGRSYGIYDWRKGPVKLQLPAGPHRVNLSAEDKKPYQGVIQVPGGQTLDIHVNFEEAKSYAAPIALTVLALGSGVGAGITANAASNLDPRDPNEAPTKSALENATIIGIISAGVIGVSAGVFFFDFGEDSRLSLEKPKEFDAPEMKRPGLSGVLVPFVGPSQGGIGLRAVF